MRVKEQVTVAPGTGYRRRWLPRPSKPGASLLAPQLRKPASLVTAGCLLLVVALGIASAHQSHGDAIDRAVDSWILGLRIPSSVLSALSLLGGGAELTALTGLLAIGCLAARRLSGAVLAAGSVLVAATLTEFVLKPVVHRTLAGDLTYPSGHTTGVFALVTVIAVLTLGSRQPAHRPAARIAAVIAASVIASAVGFAMIGLRYHYFTDTVGGAAVGIGAALGIALLLDTGVIRSWVSRPR